MFLHLDKDYGLARDGKRRIIKPPERYDHANMISYALIVGRKIENQEEPRSYDEAISSKDSSKWIKVVEKEMASLEKNQI